MIKVKLRIKIHKTLQRRLTLCRPIEDIIVQLILVVDKKQAHCNLILICNIFIWILGNNIKRLSPCCVYYINIFLSKSIWKLYILMLSDYIICGPDKDKSPQVTNFDSILPANNGKYSLNYFIYCLVYYANIFISKITGRNLIWYSIKINTLQ